MSSLLLGRLNYTVTLLYGVEYVFELTAITNYGASNPVELRVRYGKWKY